MSGSRQEGAFAFTGDWREFAPIAFTNLLLSIVTLGLYLFWARTRERRYLWSRTRFIDDRLEWTGTGLELLIGYGLAFVLIVLPLGGLQFVIQGIVLHGHPGLAVLLTLVVYILLLYLIGVARFRALRYRLSRSYWHGIRGGSDARGLRYGWSYLWKTPAGLLPFGLAIPWSMTRLWNDRWNAMSFGPLRFNAAARAGPIYLRFLAFYLSPVILFLALFGLMGFLAVSGGLHGLGPRPDPSAAAIAAIIVFVLGFYVVLGVVALYYYAAFFREAIGMLALGDLEFGFDATTWQWIKLIVGNLLLVYVTLGIGYIFVGYRNWSFFIRHLRAHGDVRLDAFTQSTTRAPGQGEGLLDAFDIGAF